MKKKKDNLTSLREKISQMESEGNLKGANLLRKILERLLKLQKKKV